MENIFLNHGNIGRMQGKKKSAQATGSPKGKGKGKGKRKGKGKGNGWSGSFGRKSKEPELSPLESLKAKLNKSKTPLKGLQVTTLVTTLVVGYEDLL